jgi:hypothetical protein
MAFFGKFRQINLATLVLMPWSMSASPPAQAQQGTAVLFQNVRIFDGKSDVLSGPSNVLWAPRNAIISFRPQRITA